MKIKLLFFLFITSIVSLFACEVVESKNAGESAMLIQLKHILDKNIAWSKNIIIGAGMSGCEAFQKKHKNKTKILLTWQYLKPLETIDSGVIIVIPKHADCKQLNRFKKKIFTNGVLHTTTNKKIKSSPLLSQFDDRLKEGVNLIVMLPGDVQQENGEWRLYTTKDAHSFREKLQDFCRRQKYNKILILNGPRTGKHTKTHEIDESAHKKDSLDRITQIFLNQKTKNWVVIDFKFGTQSAWLPALQAAKLHSVPILMESSSTSMISELQSLGIKPIVYKNPAMTPASENYIKILLTEQRVYDFDSEENFVEFTQKPIPPQDMMIVKFLTQNQS